MSRSSALGPGVVNSSNHVVDSRIRRRADVWRRGRGKGAQGAGGREESVMVTPRQEKVGQAWCWGRGITP